MVIRYSRTKIVIASLVALAVFVAAGSFAFAAPTGSSVTGVSVGSANASAPGNNSAQAGNVTEVTLFAISKTMSWQGYYGNVSGTIQLADAGDSVMYNWSLASPQGEVFASTNQTIAWTSIQCFNFTATGAYSGSETAGATSLYGTNITQLESEFGITAGDGDAVNETFTLLGSGHDAFYVSNYEFAAGECRSTRIYSNAGLGEDNKFEEVLLYEPSTASTIFASLLEEDLAGFDSRSHDFEMLVLENGHGANSGSTPYFFFVELE